MRIVKLVSKNEEDSWFKPGTEVWNEDTKSRFTEEEYNKWVDSGNIVVCGTRVSEADGEEYEDSELCPIEEFEVTFLDALKPCPFCGGQNVFILECEVDCCGAKPRSIECDCGCILMLGTCDTEQEAITAWNRRS